MALSALGLLRLTDQEAWARKVAQAMKAAQGRIPTAAETLGVSGRQLHRWLEELPDIVRAAPGRPWPEKSEREAEKPKAKKSTKAAAGKKGAKKKSRKR